MKKYCISIALLLTLVISAPVSAQFLGQMAPASVVETGHSNFGTYLMVGENSLGVAGQLRYGLSDFIEGRARLGFIDPEGGDMNFILGADLKYLIMPYDSVNSKFDLALGGGFEYTDFGYASYLGLQGSVIGSMPMTLKNNRSIEPYARLGLRMQRVSLDKVTTYAGTTDGGSDTKLKIGLNVGAEFRVIDLTDFTAELQIDDEVGFFFGITIAEF